MTDPHDATQLTSARAEDGASQAPTLLTAGVPSSPSTVAPDGATLALVLPGVAAAGRYELRDEIARGGMGAVFAARDHALGRDVAVKVLRPDLAGQTRIASRFVEEARITGQLQHPGIPPVHDLGTLPDGRPFIAMKLIKGRTLAELLKERPDLAHGLVRLLGIFEQVCQAVAYAHSKGVIHRDLKPANVMVGGFGEVQVMDWGLAKVLDEASGKRQPPDEGNTDNDRSHIEPGRSPDSATQAGWMLGTPAYMPPEQARGEVDRTDRRADVFGLGALLCEILTGKPPYAGSGQQVRVQAQAGILVEALQRLDASRDDAELRALAMHCLSPSPDDRPADGDAVAKAFRIALDKAANQLRRRLRRFELSRSLVAMLFFFGGFVAFFVTIRLLGQGR